MSLYLRLASVASSEVFMPWLRESLSGQRCSQTDPEVHFKFGVANEGYLEAASYCFTKIIPAPFFHSAYRNFSGSVKKLSWPMGNRYNSIILRIHDLEVEG
jgi:hypothetical protein